MIKNLLTAIKPRQLPCQKLGYCPYEYGQGSDRDIEGMPFPVNRLDTRKCPVYGHVCPVFMEDFQLTVEDLAIRATIHCGAVAKSQLETGKWRLGDMDPEQADQIKALLERFEERMRQYPAKDYPQYY